MRNTPVLTPVPAAALLSGALLAGPALAQDLTQFRYGTNWVAQAEHGGFYQAMVDGTYAECGLDVTIVPGGPQVNGRAMMLAGRLEGFMGGNTLEAFDAVKENIPLKVVFAAFQKEPQVILTHPGAASSFEDLKNLTLFIGDAGYASYYQWMISAFGFTPDQRRVYTYNAAPFIADPMSGMQGYVTSEPFAVEREGGFKPDVWVLADEGFETYSTTVEVRTDFLEANPEAVKCFAEGSAIGWVNFLYGDNEAAIAKIQEDNPDMSDEQIAFSIASLKEYGIVDSGDALELGIGAMTDARIRSFYDSMVEAGVIDAGIDIEQAYTLEFVNQGVGLDLKRELTGE
jgi:NitT/TauT family transport system substrate-binding protein